MKTIIFLLAVELIMARGMAQAGVQDAPMVSDGDAAYARVDTRRPAHELPPGTLADAVNKMLPDGRAWPRWAVYQQEWGAASLMNREFDVCGYERFEDPEGYDTGVLLTDDWRDQAGEDGGRGRAWRILPGNGPKAIPMNGHDIYGTARLIECLQGIVMLRQDVERHYFSAAAVLAGGNKIQLNCAPNWEDGDEVYLWADKTLGSVFMGGAGVVGNTVFHVKTGADNKVQLFLDQADAVAGTNPVTWTGAIGRFYLERRSATSGYYGNGAPALLAQPDLDANPWYVPGFLSVPDQIYVQAYDVATGVLTVFNHNFTPGQAVKYWSATGAAFTAYFVFVVDPNHVQVMTTESDALAGTNPVTGIAAPPFSTYTTADYLVNASASGQAMPPGREGAFIGQRLVIVNGLNNVVVSDPNDVLHYTLLNGFTANVGTGGQTNAVCTVANQDTLLILNANSVLALYNFAEGSANWVLREITREYGCLAPLSLLQRGASTMFLSHRGYDRVLVTPFGVVLPVENPASLDVDKYVRLIDWTHAGGASASMVDSRLLLALPQKGQIGGVYNNAVLSLNLQNSSPDKDEWAWEGVWTGALLRPYAFCVLNVFGKEWITYADYNGNVNWLADGWMDLGTTPIADSMTTRRYTGTERELRNSRKIWNRAKVTWDTYDPLLTVAAVGPGYGEARVLAPCPMSYDRTKYAAGEGPDYDPATQTPPFGNPYREDYSLAGPGELIGGVPDVHQNATETFYPRVDAWGLQLTIANTQGSARIGAVDVAGLPGPKASSRHI